MSNAPLPYSNQIAETIRARISQGVTMSVIFDEVKEMKNGPGSYSTFYKLYRSDIVGARANLHAGVGAKIMQKALVDGDMRALELLAKTRLGWSEKIIVEERDPETSVDHDTSAIDDLLAKLGLKKEEE
jgi:hypothetical protein